MESTLITCFMLVGATYILAEPQSLQDNIKSPGSISNNEPTLVFPSPVNGNVNSSGAVDTSRPSFVRQNDYPQSSSYLNKDDTSNGQKTSSFSQFNGQPAQNGQYSYSFGGPQFSSSSNQFGSQMQPPQTWTVQPQNWQANPLSASLYKGHPPPPRFVSQQQGFGPDFGGQSGAGFDSVSGYQHHPHLNHAHPFRSSTQGGPMSGAPSSSSGGFMPNAGGVMPSLMYLTTPGFWIPTSPMWTQQPGYGFPGRAQYTGQGPYYSGFQGHYQRPGEMNGGFTMQGGMPGGQYAFQGPNEGSAGYNPMMYGLQRPHRPRPILNTYGTEGSDINAPNFAQMGTVGTGLNVGETMKDGQPQGYSLYQNGANSGSIQGKDSGVLIEKKQGGNVGLTDGSLSANGNTTVEPVEIKLETKKPEESKNLLPNAATGMTIESDQLPSGEIKIQSNPEVNETSANTNGDTVLSGATERDGIPDNLNVLADAVPKQNALGMGQGMNIAAMPSNMQGSTMSTESLVQAEKLGADAQTQAALGESQIQNEGGTQMQAGGVMGKGGQIKLVTVPAQKTQTIKLQTVGSPAMSKTMSEGGGSYTKNGNGANIKLITMPQNQAMGFFSQGGKRQQLNQNGGGSTFGASGDGRYTNIKMISGNGRPKYQVYPNSFIVTPIKTKLQRPSALLDESYEDMTSEPNSGKTKMEIGSNNKIGSIIRGGDAQKFPK